MPNLLHLTFAIPTKRELEASGESFSVMAEGVFEHRTRPIFWQEKLEGWHLQVLDPADWQTVSVFVLDLLQSLGMSALLEGKAVTPRQ